MSPDTRSSDRRRPAADSAETATALKLFVVLSRAATAVQRQASDDVARHGLTISEFAVLEALFHKGPLLLGEVQRVVLVSSGGITFLVDRLEGKGLVERRECQEDRRARYAALTRAGETLMRRIFPPHAARIRAAMSALTLAQQRELTALLRTLGSAADSLSG
ncbi:MAG TPA: MarR family transcriptional regulator [Gemmatimonadaceae bacterium]|nr:MarR family transcriptional regulator [Gemmatimonadaceae bacterium]